MKTRRAFRVILTLAFLSVNAQAETAEELAKDIIRKERLTIHNILGANREEIEEFAAWNSRRRLNAMMQRDQAVSEEIILCYAIRVLDESLGNHRIRDLSIGRTPRELEMLEKRLILARRLIEIDQTKAQVQERSATGSD
jgi:hypothetical protein